ncbi:hypothetical protein SFHH103_psfHH103d_170 (plasmid) [Sinorhizobium fredii HH103]|nr:hypothetical protein SFHH103_04466 [Sinorhizobium fredii HH103]CEO91366.1 hypothetical protein SFHH103_psfHH103d_170 [Sinorhizobium fredii HH103]
MIHSGCFLTRLLAIAQTLDQSGRCSTKAQRSSWSTGWNSLRLLHPRAPPSTSFPHLAQAEQEGEVSVRIDEGEAPLSRWSHCLLTSLLVTFCFV